MRREAINLRNFWMQSAIVLFLLGGLIVWGIEQMFKPWNADELRIALGELRSQTAEASKIAEQAARMTRPFFSAQTGSLADQAEEVLSELKSARPASGLESRLSKARDLAAKVVADLRQLNAADPDRVQAMADKMAKLSAQLKTSEEAQ